MLGKLFFNCALLSRGQIEPLKFLKANFEGKKLADDKKGASMQNVKDKIGNEKSIFPFLTEDRIYLLIKLPLHQTAL